MKTLLQTLGFRTSCCNAKLVTWHHDKYFCAKCERWVGRKGQVLKTTPEQSQPVTKPKLAG